MDGASNNLCTESDLAREVQAYGAKDMDLCMQCGTCSASCPLSRGSDSFPRKIYRYLQLGLRDKLLASVEPWLCYYCGECNQNCPRGAEPAETMMATRRWLTAQYDWTGLARRFYTSEKWEFGALGGLGLFIILLFVFFHGPVITDRVSVNTFAPVVWIEIGDLTMAFLLSAFLFSNAFRMHRFIMAGTKVPLRLYREELKTFVLHFATQKRWSECGGDRTRWIKHLFLVTGYLTMMSLIIVFIRWFQVDDSSWHFSALFGYYATGTIMGVTGEMMYSRYRQKELMHRYSELSDWLFLILLFATAFTGLVMHLFRLAGFPVATYVTYVIHLAIAVPMLMIEVPFGKWSHLFYRPLAIFLSRVREKAIQPSVTDLEETRKRAQETFQTCMQCGTCTSVCPQSGLSPRLALRAISLDTATRKNVDNAAWQCLTCNNCLEHCPRGIDMADLLTSVRAQDVLARNLPSLLEHPLESLNTNNNPWGGSQEQRTQWAHPAELPACYPDMAYCLFTCCTTAHDTDPDQGPRKAGKALLELLDKARVSFGTLGTKERCCGDLARTTGSEDLFNAFKKLNTRAILETGVDRLLVNSPHCLQTFTRHYDGLDEKIAIHHHTEVLAELIREKRLVPEHPVNARVTFHDPCYLGRHAGSYDHPRTILNSIPGIERVEMVHTRENSLCCGGGGGGAWLQEDCPPMDRLSRRRIREALDTGAEIIATACPYCIRMLSEAIRDMGVQDKIRVCDVAELLAESMGTESTNSDQEKNHD
jgi:Fe-S oxidoreductase